MATRLDSVEQHRGVRPVEERRLYVRDGPIRWENPLDISDTGQNKMLHGRDYSVCMYKMYTFPFDAHECEIIIGNLQSFQVQYLCDYDPASFNSFGGAQWDITGYSELNLEDLLQRGQNSNLMTQ